MAYLRERGPKLSEQEWEDLQFDPEVEKVLEQHMKVFAEIPLCKTFLLVLIVEIKK